MPRYVVERHFGPMDVSALDDPAWVKRRVEANERYPLITWEHSFSIQAGDGLVTYCIYFAPDAQYIRDHAAAAGVPADVVTEADYITPDRKIDAADALRPGEPLGIGRRSDT